MTEDNGLVRPDVPVLKDATLGVEDRVAVMTFTRDDVRNALTGTGLIDDIVAVCDFVNYRPDISVLVMTGQGNAFSAGGNIHHMAARVGDFSGDVAELEERYRRGIQRIPLAMESVEIPVIAAVNGPAVGAGFDLANMADIRIASEKAKFGETFLTLGIVPGDGGAWFLQRLIGYQRAAELTMTARIIPAQEAKDIGIVLDVVAPEQLMDHAMSLARRMAAHPPKAARRTKRLMKAAQRMELRDFLDYTAALQGMSHNDPEHADAVAAFIAAMKK